jgi:hypothetical protein
MKLNIRPSSHIAGAEYDPKEKLLRVEFKDGAHHDYWPVDQRTATNFEFAPSPGRYLHHVILPNHSHRPGKRKQ